MKTNVPYLNISDKQYQLIGITWGLIIAALFHFYKVFDQAEFSIVRTFFSTEFLLMAGAYMIIGYLVSYYGFRIINR